MSESPTPLVSAHFTQPATPEKRRFIRYSIDVAVKVKVKTSSGISSYCYGRGGDLSEGGMAVNVAHELSRGKTVHLSLTLPHCDRPIECEAVVRHRSQYHYGLEFQGLAEQDRELLLRACRALGVVQQIA
jgi:c-di-GMP-binding flagellar brake protein YcgR